MKIILFLTIIFICVFAYAALLPQPPVDREKSTAEQQYLRVLYDQHNILQVVTANPNGSRRGRYGEMILLKSGSNFYLEICISEPSGTVWKGVQITTAP